MKNNKKTNFSAVVLAAGVGKRMQSQKSKVLHKINGQPMIQKTVNTLLELSPKEIVIVANKDNLKDLKTIFGKNVSYSVQAQPLGTANAADVGFQSLKTNSQNIAILYGDDTAFYAAQTIKKVFQKHLKSNAKITFVTVLKKDPKGLGRILRKNGQITAIVEEKDASFEQKKINEVNDGLYFFDRQYLERNLREIKPSKATKELYLTDLIGIALKNKEEIETFAIDDEGEWHGINTQLELAIANLRLNKKIHFMGVLGSGASSVASIAKEYGFKVSGCDLNTDYTYLDKAGMKVKKGHDASHLVDIACLVVSPAITKFDPENEEISKAKDESIPIITWQEFQGAILQKEKFTICIAGGYGKSTTTAMVAKVLTETDFNPTCELGAKVLEWGKNFRVGKSKYYICEADEYNDNFLNYSPDIAIVLNIAWDHPDFFPNKQSVIISYQQFINKIQEDGTLIITNQAYKQLKNGIRKDINVKPIKNFPNVNLSLIGDFRAENADAALTLAQALKIDTNKAKKALESFKGLSRRLEYKGEIEGVKFFDDYAVQPYTVLKSANALCDKYPKSKVTLVLEPHTFSRVKKFFNEFLKAIKNIKVDRVLIIDTYPAREIGNAQKTSEDLAASIGKKSIYTGTINKTASYIKENIKSFDIVCSMGAGQANKLFELIKNE
jgi:UDP-N-acetylmuramate--alanine ligase